jgi:predicted nucleotidyltransferase
MGTKRGARPKGSMPVADALFARTRMRVLSLLLGQPDRAFGTTEVIGLVGAGSGAVQRELDRFALAGLLTATTAGRQKLYQANRASPVFAEVSAIVEKTAGVADALRRALRTLGPRLRLAILYGSVAKETERATSDIDVLLVGDGLTLEAAYRALAPAEKKLGRRISPTLYTSEEFERRRAERRPFLTKVLAGKHVVLVGEAHGNRAAR